MVVRVTSHHNILCSESSEHSSTWSNCRTENWYSFANDQNNMLWDNKKIGNFEQNFHCIQGIEIIRNDGEHNKKSWTNKFEVSH